MAALIVGTAPNDYDALWYHLARAAFWKQQHAIAYIAGANDARLNGFPPNAEIAASFTMILGRTERFAGFVQLAALAGDEVAVAGIARRIGLSVRQALFGALLFATLPVVVLQSATALNDLVFGAFLACCAYFLFTWRPVTLALAALALGLALGRSSRRSSRCRCSRSSARSSIRVRRWPALVLVGVGGIVLGSTGTCSTSPRPPHQRQVAEAKNATTIGHGNTHSVGGTSRTSCGSSSTRSTRPARSAATGSCTSSRRALILGSGCVCAGAWGPGSSSALLRSPRCRSPSARSTTSAARLPEALGALDRRDLAFLGFDKHLTRASPFQSWYGALGLVLVIACFVLAWIARRRARCRASSGARAGAVDLARAAVDHDLLQPLGRALRRLRASRSAPRCGGCAARSAPRVGGDGIGVIALALALVHYDEKPSGVNVLGGSAPTSVWDLSRAQVLGRFLEPGEREVVAALGARPGKATPSRSRSAARTSATRTSAIGSTARWCSIGAPGSDWIVVAPGRPAALTEAARGGRPRLAPLPIR